MNFIEMYQALEEGKIVERKETLTLPSVSPQESNSAIVSSVSSITYQKTQMMGEICYGRKINNYDGYKYLEVRTTPFFHDSDFTATDWESCSQ